MALQDSRDDEEEDYVLVATMDNARNLSSILKAINFKEVKIFPLTI